MSLQQLEEGHSSPIKTSSTSELMLWIKTTDPLGAAGGLCSRRTSADRRLLDCFLPSRSICSRRKAPLSGVGCSGFPEAFGVEEGGGVTSCDRWALCRVLSAVRGTQKEGGFHRSASYWFVSCVPSGGRGGRGGGGIRIKVREALWLKKLIEKVEVPLRQCPLSSQMVWCRIGPCSMSTESNAGRPSGQVQRRRDTFSKPLLLTLT